MIAIDEPSLALEMVDVTFGYPGVQILFPSLTLKVRIGEFVSMVGRSGSGKSTALKLAGSLIQPDSGTVRANGIVRTVFQDHNLFPWFSVLRNVQLGGLATSANPGEVRAKSLQLLSELGLEKMAHRSVGSLSGGEQQRVAIARAFVANPSLVLMDEPFSALDEFRRRSAENFLMKFRADKNAGILFVTHNIEEAILLGNRVVVVNNLGQLLDYQVPFPFPRPTELIFEPEFIELRRAISGNFTA